MTITQEAPDQPVTGEAEALFPEARRRRRRIRLAVGAGILALAVVVAGVIYGIGGSNASPPVPRPTPSSTGPGELVPAKVIRETLSVGSAREAWQTITSYPGCSPPVSGSGVIDLVHMRSAVTVSSPGCHAGDGSYSERGSYRTIEIGSALYQTRQPQEAWDYGAGKSWLRTSPYSQGELSSADPLSVLKAVSGPFMRVGSSTIRGVATTEYVDSASVASVQAAGLTRYGPIGTTDPPLKQIPVQVDIWIDAEQRLRQVSTWEPYYTQNNADGSSEGGAYIVNPSPTADAPPRQQGFVQTTLDLWQFGTPIDITPPPAAKVATPG